VNFVTDSTRGFESKNADHQARHRNVVGAHVLGFRHCDVRVRYWHVGMAGGRGPLEELLDAIRLVLALVPEVFDRLRLVKLLAKGLGARLLRVRLEKLLTGRFQPNAGGTSVAKGAVSLAEGDPREVRSRPSPCPGSQFASSRVGLPLVPERSLRLQPGIRPGRPGSIFGCWPFRTGAFRTLAVLAALSLITWRSAPVNRWRCVPC
jgi:hypothetical protein